MSWIDPKHRMPPAGLQVLLEVSGRYSGFVHMVADHDFYLGSWINPEDREPFWMIEDASDGFDEHILDPVVHAWMPLPRHYQPNERGFTQEEDLMEHAMFEDDPDWLYKDDAVYEQRTIEDFLWEVTHENT